MPRSSWASLSSAYRARLERGGITRQQYESGTSLQKARGHAKTPERPERAVKQPGKYRDYLNDRKRLEAAVQSKKLGYFGDVHKFRHSRSNVNVTKNPVTGKQVPLSDLRMAANATETQWMGWLSSRSERWAFLFYH